MLLMENSAFDTFVAFPWAGPDQLGLGVQGAAAQRGHLPVRGVHQTEAKGCV